MKPEQISEAFNQAINDFTTHIESMWTTLPVIKKTLDKTEKEQTTILKDYLDKHANVDSASGKQLIPVEHQRRVGVLETQVRKTQLARNAIQKSFLVSVFSQFDTYVADLMKCVYSAVPDILNGSDRQISFKELQTFPTIADAQNHIVDKEIETVLRSSLPDQFRWFENKANLTLTKDLESWPTLIEASQRRNLFVHTTGKVSAQYLNVCGEYKVPGISQVKVGDVLIMSPAYFDEVCRAVIEISVKLNQVIRRKLLPQELAVADKCFVAIVVELLLNEEYEIAKRLCDFETKYFKKYSNEDARLRMVINRAQVYKWSGDNDGCKKIVGSLDWSATNHLFKMASAILLDDFETAFSEMEKLGTGDDDKLKQHYREWPIFREVRKLPRFKEIFKSIFKENLVPVEPVEVKNIYHTIDLVLKTFKTPFPVEVESYTQAG